MFKIIAREAFNVSVTVGMVYGGYIALEKAKVHIDLSFVDDVKDWFAKKLDCHSVDEKTRVIFVLGGPGSGKGTVCARLVDEFGINHISAGDELRAARDAGTDVSTLINNYIMEGQIVPVEITCDLLKQAIDRAPVNPIDMIDSSRVFLIDGFPRNADNVDGWKKAFEKKYNNGKISDICVLHLVADEDAMVQRCLGRAAEQARNDDNVESIRKRLQTYEQSTKPVLDCFREDTVVYDVDANKPAEKVFRGIVDILRNDGLRKRIVSVEQEQVLTQQIPRHVPYYYKRFNDYLRARAPAPCPIQQEILMQQE